MSSAKVNGIGLAVMGVLIVAFGFFLTTLTEATCEGEVMAAGDRCVTVSDEGSVSQDRDQVLAGRHMQGYAVAGIGVLFILGAGFFVLRGRRQGRVEQDVDAAASDWNRAA
jgi:hypothetical protein